MTNDMYNVRGPGAVVKAVCLKSRRSRFRTPLWPSSFKETKMFLPRSVVKILYCGELSWSRGSVLGLRPPGFEFRILCLKGNVISFISWSSLAYMCTKVAWDPIHFIPFVYVHLYHVYLPSRHNRALCWINAGLTLVHHLRGWTNGKATLIQRLVSAGCISWSIICF